MTDINETIKTPAFDDATIAALQAKALTDGDTDTAEDIFVQTDEDFPTIH